MKTAFALAFALLAALAAPALAQAQDADLDALRASLEKTGRLVIAHEAAQRGGFGAEVAAVAAGECWDLLRGPIVRVCGANTPMPYAPELERFVIPDAERLAEAVRSLVGAGVA